MPTPEPPKIPYGGPCKACCEIVSREDETPETFEEGCGYSFDHDTVETYREEDGVGWECRRCGAEGWEASS